MKPSNCETKSYQSHLLLSLPVDTFEEASKNDSTIKCTDAETTIPDPSNCQHFFACNNGTAHKLVSAAMKKILYEMNT